MRRFSSPLAPPSSPPLDSMPSLSNFRSELIDADGKVVENMDVDAEDVKDEDDERISL